MSFSIKREILIPQILSVLQYIGENYFDFHFMEDKRPSKRGYILIGKNLLLRGLTLLRKEPKLKIAELLSFIFPSVPIHLNSIKGIFNCY